MEAISVMDLLQARRQKMSIPSLFAIHPGICGAASEDVRLYRRPRRALTLKNQPDGRNVRNNRSASNSFTQTDKSLWLLLWCSIYIYGMYMCKATVSLFSENYIYKSIIIMLGLIAIEANDIPFGWCLWWATQSAEHGKWWVVCRLIGGLRLEWDYTVFNYYKRAYKLWIGKIRRKKNYFANSVEV